MAVEIPHHFSGAPLRTATLRAVIVICFQVEIIKLIKCKNLTKGPGPGRNESPRRRSISAQSGLLNQNMSLFMEGTKSKYFIMIVRLAAPIRCTQLYELTNNRLLFEIFCGSITDVGRLGSKNLHIENMPLLDKLQKLLQRLQYRVNHSQNLQNKISNSRIKSSLTLPQTDFTMY